MQEPPLFKDGVERTGEADTSLQETLLHYGEVLVDVFVAQRQFGPKFVTAVAEFVRLFHPPRIGCRLPILYFRRRGVVQETGPLGEAEFFLIDDEVVPDGVEIGGFGVAKPVDGDAVASEVVAFAGVEGLVEIANHVHQKFQGVDSFFLGRIWIAKRGFESLQGDEYIAGGVLVHGFVGLAIGNVDVVPGIGLFPGGGFRADLIGPIGDFGETVGTQEGANGGGGVGSEMVFGNLADDAVAGLAPGKGCDGEKKQGEDGFRHEFLRPR